MKCEVACEEAQPYRDSVCPSGGTRVCGSSEGNTRPAAGQQFGAGVTADSTAVVTDTLDLSWLERDRPDGTETSDRVFQAFASRCPESVPCGTGLLWREWQRQRSGDAALPGSKPVLLAGSARDSSGSPSPRPGRMGPALPGPCRALQPAGPLGSPSTGQWAATRRVPKPGPCFREL